MSLIGRGKENGGQPSTQERMGLRAKREPTRTAGSEETGNRLLFTVGDSIQSPLGGLLPSERLGFRLDTVLDSSVASPQFAAKHELVSATPKMERSRRSIWTRLRVQSRGRDGRRRIPLAKFEQAEIKTDAGGREFVPSGNSKTEAIHNPTGRQEASRPHLNKSQFSEYLRKETVPVDYAKMVSKDTRVLALGETHDSIITKREIIDHIGQFKALGFTHIGMEMLGTDFQPSLDEYRRTGGRTEEIMEGLGQFGYSAEVQKLYFEIIEKARRVGITVVAINAPNSEIDNCTNHSAQLKTQNETMTKTVQAILDPDPGHVNDPKNKMVTLTGARHARKEGGDMANLLADGGVSVVTVSINHSHSHFEETLAQLNLQHDSLMAANLGKLPDSLMPYDWMMHLI